MVKLTIKMLVISCWLVWHMQWANNLSLHRVFALWKRIVVNNLFYIWRSSPVKLKLLILLFVHSFLVCYLVKWNLYIMRWILQLSLSLTSLQHGTNIGITVIQVHKIMHLEIKWCGQNDWHVFLTKQKEM